jgi:hypothetical protein
MVKNWQDFFLYWAVAWLVFFGVFYIPGRVVLTRFDKTKEHGGVVIAVFLGMAMLGLAGYIFGYLNLRFLVFFYLLYCWARWLRSYREEACFLIKDVKKLFSDKLLSLIIILGLPISVSTVFTSGLPGSEGTGFFGINPIDGSYHIALIKSIVRSIPPEEPGLAGSLVQNYHYWSDLILAEIVRLFKLPPINLFYHYFPTFLAILYGLAGYRAGLLLTGDKKIARLMSFFLLLSGNLGYLVMLLLTGKLTFSIASLDNAALLFTNPPRVLAQGMFLTGLSAVYYWLKTEKLSWGIVSAILLGICVGIKVYVGIFASAGLAVLFFVFLYKRKYKMIVPIVVAATIGILIFFPANKNAGGLFWSPLSWPHHFFAQGEASKLMWHLQMDEFEVHNNKLRIFILNVQMVVVFLVITFGTRILGFLGLFFGQKKLGNEIFLFLAAPFLLFIFVGLFFLQESGIFESFNFIAVSTVAGSMFTSIFLAKALNFATKKQSLYIKLGFFGLVGVAVLLTVPRTVYDAKYYLNLYKIKSGQILTWDQMKMFEEMGRTISPSSLVLTDIKDQLGSYSPYVAAFSGTRMFFSGEGILKAHGLEVGEKSVWVKELFNKEKRAEFANEAEKAGIEYLYLQRPLPESFRDKKYFEVLKESDSSALVYIKDI